MLWPQHVEAITDNNKNTVHQVGNKYYTCSIVERKMCNTKHANVQIGTSYSQQREVTEYCCSFDLCRTVHRNLPLFL